MKSEIVSRAIAYFHTEPHAADVAAAFHAFVSDLDGDESELIDDESIRMLFLEWMLFDHRLANGRTFFEHYAAVNESFLKEEELRECRDILSENEYGMFVVEAVRPGYGMRVRSAASGNVYDVLERTGSNTVAADQIIFVRVVRMGDQYEFLSGIIHSFEEMRLGKSLEEQIRKEKYTITPKDVAGWIVGRKDRKKKESDKGDEEEWDLDTARSRLSQILRETGLEKMVGMNDIETWIRTSSMPGAVARNSVDVVSILMGLGRDVSRWDAYMDDIVRCVSVMNNALPHDTLGGKSPNEMREDPRNRGPIDTDIHEYGDEAVQHFNDAVRFMQSGSTEKMKVFLDKGFHGVLERREVFPDPYRPFGNLAAYYAMVNMPAYARAAIDMALDLNPNYEFGNKTRRRIDDLFSPESYIPEEERRERAEMFESSVSFSNRISDASGERAVFEELQKYGWESVDREELLAAIRKIGGFSQAQETLLEKPYLEKCRRKNEGPKMYYDLVAFSATRRLWELWRDEDERVYEDFSKAMLDVNNDGPEEGAKTNDAIAEHFFDEVRICLNDRNRSAMVSGASKYPGEFYQNMDALVEMCLHDAYRERAIALAKTFREIFDDERYEFFEIIEQYEASGSWREMFDRFVVKRPRDTVWHTYMAYYLVWGVEDLRSAKDLLQDAWDQTARRDLEGRSASDEEEEEEENSLYDSYIDIGDRLLEVCEELGDKKCIRSIERELERIEKRKEELSPSPGFVDAVYEETQNKYAERARKAIEREPAGKYYAFLKKTGIVFATDDPTKDQVTVRRADGSKVGRNDPCPCGARKANGKPMKYKKCCGR